MSHAPAKYFAELQLSIVTDKAVYELDLPMYLPKTD